MELINVSVVIHLCACIWALKKYESSCSVILIQYIQNITSSIQIITLSVKRNVKKNYITILA
jgi:hypothetical protein